MNIGIYGLGRFGQFWGKVLAPLGYPILGYNRSDRSVIPDITPVSLDQVAKVDTLFLCTAISSIPDVCKELAPLVGPDTLVVDTCSVKLFPAQIMAETFHPDVPLLPIHPMFGPDSAKNRDLPLVICPDPRNHQKSQELSSFWSDAFTQLGMRVIPMTAQDHDMEAARTQGITHVIGRILSDLHLKPSDIATLGYTKLFEVMEQTCNDPWQLFVDLQRYNPHTQHMRQDLESSVKKLLGTLEQIIHGSPDAENPSHSH